MKPVPHLSVANIRISKQMTKFYLSFFTLFLPNAPAPPLPPCHPEQRRGISSSIKHQTSSRLIPAGLLCGTIKPT